MGLLLNLLDLEVDGIAGKAEHREGEEWTELAETGQVEFHAAQRIARSSIMMSVSLNKKSPRPWPRRSSFLESRHGDRVSPKSRRVRMLSGTSLTFLCFVDSKRASVHLLTVQLFDGLASTVVIHLDEAEATRAAGFTVENDS